MPSGIWYENTAYCGSSMQNSCSSSPSLLPLLRLGFFIFSISHTFQIEFHRHIRHATTMPAFSYTSGALRKKDIKIWLFQFGDAIFRNQWCDARDAWRPRLIPPTTVATATVVLCDLLPHHPYRGMPFPHSRMADWNQCIKIIILCGHLPDKSSYMIILPFLLPQLKWNTTAQRNFQF